MNPSKVQKSEMVSTSNFSKQAYIQPGALARGRGQSLRALGSLRVTAEPRTTIGKSNSCLVPPGFDPMEGDVPPSQAAKVTQHTQRIRISSCEFEKTKKMRGMNMCKNFARLKPGETMRNELAKKNCCVPLSFDQMDDDVSPCQEADATQDDHRIDLIRCESEKAKKVRGMNMCKNVARFKPGETIRNELAKKYCRVPPSFDQMDDDVSSGQEAEVTQDDRRIDLSRCESEKAKKVRGTNMYKNVARLKPGETIRNELAKKNCHVPPSFDQMEDDVSSGQEAEVTQDDQRIDLSRCESEKAKNVRGKNMCKTVTKLKPGEKLRVTFYHNRVVGENHASFTRHLGLLVRDSNMCPFRVHSWTDIEEYKLEHMWAAVIEKFDSDDMNDHKDHVLQHMRRLWNNWRGSLHKNVKAKPLHEVLKDVPERVDKSDWEWLVKEHFLSDKFKEASTRNSVNRSKLKMPHRTGSKPIREVIYDLGGKDGKPPDMATIFFETRKKDNKLVEPETNEKYVEIKELVQSEPSLSHIEVVERCFGSQRKSHAVGFGGGITVKELKGGNSSKAALLDELKACRKEKEALQKRVDKIERRQEWFESILLHEHSSPASSSDQPVD